MQPSSCMVLLVLAATSPLAMSCGHEHDEGFRKEETRRTLRSLRSAIEYYRVDHGSYPTNEQGLQVLLEPLPISTMDRQSSTYADPNLLSDAWGQQIEYTRSSSGEGYSICSVRREGQATAICETVP